MRRVLITGAGGFIGRHLAPVLETAGWVVKGIGHREIGDLESDIDWRPYLRGMDAVVHLAAKVHNMDEKAVDAKLFNSYFQSNCSATGKLAHQAESMGVRKFIFVSTIKVHGENTNVPITYNTNLNPTDPYSQSKAAAEKLLLREINTMSTTIIRPPLVYGPFVKGNFLKLLRIVDSGLPLPLAKIKNTRNLIYVGNLADAIRASLNSPPGIYLPCDKETFSTETLIRKLAKALNRPARLFKVPLVLLKIGGHMTGKSKIIQRLVASLIVDGKIPGWEPPYNSEEGIAETVAWWQKIKESKDP